MNRMVFDGFLAIFGLFCDGNSHRQFLADKLLGILMADRELRR
jgi:hypothetical protein